MVVKNDSPYKEIIDLKGKIFGRLQCYTTSSNFAMVLLLAQMGFSIDNFFKEIVDIAVQPGSYQEQINQVIERIVDTTMVNEDCLLKLASNTQNTRILGRVNKLPNHVVLLRNDVDFVFEEMLKIQFYGVERKGFNWLSGFKQGLSNNFSVKSEIFFS
jgi:ABC-type phosphate/phosphonate transport system substrate-binding protein